MASKSISAMPMMIATITLLLSNADAIYGDEDCSKITSAFTFNNQQCFAFVYDEHSHLLCLDLHGNFASIQDSRVLGVHEDITAAVGVPGEGRFYLYTGRTSRAYTGFNRLSDHSQPNFAHQAEGMLLSPYPGQFFDAAYARQNNLVVYFAGCYYVIVDASNGEIVSEGANADVGIPCNVDAAWASGDHKTGYISKGQLLCVWHEDEDHVIRKPLYKELPFLQHIHVCFQ